MTNATILVDKNVPLPKKKPGNIQKYPFDSMAKGDSFDAGEYERSKMQSIYGSVYFYIKKKGNTKKKFVVRKTADGKIRIWRTA